MCGSMWYMRLALSALRNVLDDLGANSRRTVSGGENTSCQRTRQKKKSESHWRKDRTDRCREIAKTSTRDLISQITRGTI